MATLATAALYLSAVQWGINGSQHPYATDVGEIQNALPRWGTIHYPGYPLYSLLGSLFVTALRLAGVQPAAGASLFSAAWGVVTAALLFALAGELGAGAPSAALGAAVAALATSQWMDSSLAEIHTMGTAFLLGVLYLALRFERYGRRRDLLALAAVFSLGAMHQRTILFLVPSVLLVIWPRLGELKRSWPAAIAAAALGPLTYLYLPIRAWQGADWVFGAVGTWRGFLQIFLDTKVERVVALPRQPGAWLTRLQLVAGALHEDLWLPVLAAGLVGLWLVVHRRQGWRRALALALAWLPSVPLALVIWEGRISDALLAAKLPVILLGGAGLALAAQAAADRDRRLGLAAAGLLVIVAGAEVRAHRPVVLAITRDPSAERMIALAEQVAPGRGGQPAAFMALWGHNYWALTYAQAYRGQLAGLTLLDHNADVAAITRQERLFTFSQTFYQRPLAWWNKRLGRAHLSSPAPEIVEVSPAAATAVDVPGGKDLDLGNGVRILSARLAPGRGGQLILTVYWQANRRPREDYSVAVHLLAHDPPQGRADILAQADRQHPVDGWYPTSRWTAGEVVCDTYVLTVPPGSQPVAVRVGMYQALPGGQFKNTPWLTLPLGG